MRRFSRGADRRVMVSSCKVPPKQLRPRWRRCRSIPTGIGRTCKSMLPGCGTPTAVRRIPMLGPGCFPALGKIDVSLVTSQGTSS